MVVPTLNDTDLDWYNYLDELEQMLLVTEVSLKQFVESEKGLNGQNEGKDCPCDTTKEDLSLPPSPSSPSSSSQDTLQRHEDQDQANDERGDYAIQSLRTPSASPPTSTSTSTKQVSTTKRKINPTSSLLSSPAKRVRSDSPCPEIRVDNQPIFSEDNYDEPHSPDPATSIPIPSEEVPQHNDLILDSSTEPQEFLCMSGALPPTETVHSRHCRIQSLLNDNDHLICSDDLNHQVNIMPFRLISSSEFETHWASVCFHNPFEALRYLPLDLYTTPRGILQAKRLADHWIQKIYEQNIQALDIEYDKFCDHNRRMCDCREEAALRARLSNAQCDNLLCRALMYFSGEFVHRARIRPVKYPEDLTSYMELMAVDEDATLITRVRRYWQEIYRRGELLWDELERGEDETSRRMAGEKGG